MERGTIYGKKGWGLIAERGGIGGVGGIDQKRSVTYLREKAKTLSDD